MSWKQREMKKKGKRSNLSFAINYILYSNLKSSSKVEVFILIYNNALREMANL